MIICATTPPVHDSAVARVALSAASWATVASGTSSDAFADDQAAESLVDQSGRGLDQRVGPRLRSCAEALMRKLMVESWAVMPTSGTRPRAVRSIAWASISDSPLPNRLILR